MHLGQEVIDINNHKVHIRPRQIVALGPVSAPAAWQFLLRLI
jgi:hypothetical protein